jgi:hypothetical protein
MLAALMDTKRRLMDDVSRPVATSHDDEPCTVSVPEASELFADAGLPRTERAIQRFCKKGELKCAFVETPFGSKYLIARSSIDRLIVQKLQARQFAPDTAVRDMTRPDATGRDNSRQETQSPDDPEEPVVPTQEALPHQPSHDTADDKERQAATAELEAKDQTIEQLRGEIFDLKVDNAGKQNFIRQLVTDRKEMAAEIKQISYELGAAQTRVAQLEAPKVTYDMSRPVATGAEDQSVAERGVTDAEPPPAAPAAAPRGSFLSRVFGGK